MSATGFIHEDSEWRELLELVSAAMDRDISLVEKDYWVIHTLWALLHQGFELWFRGGTSLSKGFDLIERFSEDIDVRIDAGAVEGLTDPKLSWKNEKQGIQERNRWFDDLTAALDVPACQVARNPAGSDPRCRSAWIEVTYPALAVGTLPGAMKSFVLLEAGRARVVPFVPRSLSSWVHDWLENSEQLGDYRDNRPQGVRCIHPWVTCLEKIDAIARRFPRSDADAASFVRHYEDTARILGARGSLPALEGAPVELAREMLSSRDIRSIPAPGEIAFASDATSARWREVQQSWEAIGDMFWGERITLDEACATIRGFLVSLEGLR